MRLTLILLICSSHAAFARTAGGTQPQPSQSNQLAAQKAAIARTPLDAIQTTCSSFLSVGGVCFIWSTGSSLFKQTPFKAACSAGLMSARKWGGTSAGFGGGRAIGQVIRGGDDVWCAVLGAAAAGAITAESVAAMPSSIGSFVLFTLALEMLAPTSTGPAAQGSDGGAANGRSLRDAQESARELARKRYAERHRGDPVRLRALAGTDSKSGRPSTSARGQNLFGEAAGEGFKPGGVVRSWVNRLNRELGHGDAVAPASR